MGVEFSISLQCHRSYKAWDFKGIEEEEYGKREKEEDTERERKKIETKEFLISNFVPL